MTIQPKIVTCHLCSSVLALKEYESICRICGTQLSQNLSSSRPCSKAVLTAKPVIELDFFLFPYQLIIRFLEHARKDFASNLQTVGSKWEAFRNRFVPSRYCFNLLDRKPLELAPNASLSFPGIYYIVNLQNKFRPIFYIGESSDIGERLKTHLETLRVGKHHSKFNSDKSFNLQGDYNRHGLNAFYFGVLEQLPHTSRYSREEVEAQFIKRLNSYESGYNAVPHQRIARKRHRYFRLKFRY